MFENCNSLKKMPDISNWDIHSLKFLEGYFENCSSLNSKPIISYKDSSNNNIGICQHFITFLDSSNVNNIVREDINFYYEKFYS